MPNLFSDVRGNWMFSGFGLPVGQNKIKMSPVFWKKIADELTWKQLLAADLIDLLSDEELLVQIENVIMHTRAAMTSPILWVYPKKINCQLQYFYN